MSHLIRFLQTLACVVLLVTSSLVTSSIGLAETRVVQFPADRNCGTIMLLKHLPPVDGMSRYGGHPKRKGIAQGKVILNDRSFIRLHISPEQSYDLSFLDSLPTDVIDGLHIGGAKIGEAEFASIARLGIEYLLLFECSIDEGIVAEHFRINPELRLLCMHECKNQLAFVRWALRGKKFQHIQTHLDASEIKALDGSRRLMTAQIELDSDFQMMFDALHLRFPNLRGLTIYEVDANSGRSNIQSASQLANLRWLDWHNPVVDAKFVATLGKLPSLETLVIHDPLAISEELKSVRSSLSQIDEVSITGARFLEGKQEADLKRLREFLKSEP